MKEERRDREKEILEALELIEEDMEEEDTGREQEKKEAKTYQGSRAEGARTYDAENRSGQSALDAGRPVGRRPGRRKQGMGPYILTALGCIVLLLLIVYAAMAIGKRGRSTYTQEEVDALVAEAAEAAKAEEADRILSGIRDNFDKGLATAAALRPFYPDEVVVATSGKIRFFPISEELAHNDYRQEDLVVLDTGELQYKQDGRVVTHKGIDVCRFQGVIDWQQVASDGVEFAIIRTGIRGYGSGAIVVDEQFENNIKGALANGIEVGVYFYSQSVTEAEAIEEANTVLELIAPYRVTGPVVYDAEKVSDADARTKNLTAEERTAMTLAFCRTIEEKGYRPMVYLNLDYAFSSLDLTQLEDYDKWLAHYTTEFYYPYAYQLWQYSEKGSVKGIDAEVDMDLCFEAWWE